MQNKYVKVLLDLGSKWLQSITTATVPAVVFKRIEVQVLRSLNDLDGVPERLPRLLEGYRLFPEYQFVLDNASKVKTDLVEIPIVKLLAGGGRREQVTQCISGVLSLLQAFTRCRIRRGE